MLKPRVGLCLQGSVPDALGKDSLLRNDLKTAFGAAFHPLPLYLTPLPLILNYSHSVVYDNILGSI